MGGEIVSYNFRCFKSPSQNLQPPTPFPKVFRGPSPSPHLAIHPSIHAALVSRGLSSWLQLTFLHAFHALANLDNLVLLLSGWFSAILLHASLFVLSSDYFQSSPKRSCKLLTDTTCLLPSPQRQTQSCGLCWHPQHSRQVEIV